MSKRLPRGSHRVFDPITGSTQVETQMTKGQALIHARNILGPDGCVIPVIGGFHCVYVRRPSGEMFLAGTGPDWESALAGAAKSEYAMAWSDRNIELGNEIEQAKDNLKKTQGAENKGRIKKFLQGLADMRRKRDETKKTNAENYELWKEGREEEYQAALLRTHERKVAEGQ